MKRVKPLSAIVLAVSLLIPWLSPIAPTARAATVSWSNWAGSTPAGFHGDKWGVPELWWYGKARIFHYGTQVSYRAEDATSFWVEGKAVPDSDSSVFGVEVEWGTPLDAGFIYRFMLTMNNPDELPDLITVNGNTVWTKDLGYTLPDSSQVHVQYVPATDEEEVTIRLIRVLDPGDPDHTTQWQRLSPPHQGEWIVNNFKSQRSAYSGARPEYDTYALPAGLSYISNDPHQTNSYYHHVYGGPVEYSREPLLDLPYSTSKVNFVERQLSPEEGMKYFQQAGIETNTFQPGGESFEEWARTTIAAGTKNLALTPVIERRDAKYPNAQPGIYEFFHMHALLAGSAGKFSPDGTTLTPQERKEKYDLMVEDMVHIIKRWMELVPDGEVYIFLPEINGAYGHYLGGISKAKLGEYPGYESVTEGGTAAWQRTFDFFNQFRSDVETQLGDQANRLQIMANFDRAGTIGAYAYHGGADIILHKNIHRQSINIVAAGSRGAGMAYDQAYGYDMDTWDRNYYYSYHPEEAAHGLMVYYHSGGQYMMDETPVREKSTGLLSRYGSEWLDFARYTKVHPELGDQRISFAIMRGLGDDWNRIAGPSASWEAAAWLPEAEIADSLAGSEVPSKWAKAAKARAEGRAIQSSDTYLADYNLLDLVFSRFGDADTTDPNRLATGTPYGPVNFIPWDTPAQKLDDYGAIAYFGRGLDTAPETLDNLRQYVQGGGTLMVAAGQLKREDGSFAADSFLGIGLGEQRELDGLPYTLLTEPPTGGEIVSTLANGDPAAVKAAYGEGTLYVLSGEWLTDRDDSLPRSLLEPVLDDLSWLELGPESDWLEYMVQQKGDAWVFPIFNHGRGYFPSRNGIDHGPWSGRVSLDLERIGLIGQQIEVFKAAYDPQFDPEASLPITLEPLPAVVEGGKLRFDLTVGEFEEIVIGPKETVKQDYWGLTEYSPISGMVLDRARLSFFPGDTQQLIADVETDSPEHALIRWTSNAPAVATVDADGVVTAKELGTATIRASVADVIAGTVYTAEAVVKVEPRLAYTVDESFDELPTGESPASWSITLGDAANSATVAEEAGTDNKLLRMDRASAAGTALIAKRPLGSLSGKIVLEAKVNAPNNNNRTRILYVHNEENQILLKLSMAFNGEFKAVDGSSTFISTGVGYTKDTWYYLKLELDTDAGVYTLFIDGERIGMYDLIPADNLRIGSIQFNLQNANTDVLLVDDVRAGGVAGPIMSVRIEPMTAVLQQEQTLQLTPLIQPAGSEDRPLEKTWTSSDDSVAAVDADGVVTAVGEGNAAIRLTVTDPLYGDIFTSECIVQVEPPQQVHVLDTFNETDEGAVPEGWTITPGADGNTAVVVGADPAASERWLMLEKTDPSWAALEASRELGGLTGRLILKASLKAPDDARHARLLYVYNSEGQTVLKASLGYDGKIRTVNGSEQLIETGLTYSGNEWIEFKFELDTRTGIFDFYVDGVETGTYRLVDIPVMNIDRLAFRLQNAYEDVLYIDDVFLSSVIEPDETPPVTAAEIDQPKLNGWYNTPVTLSLSAKDEGSGVDRIEYRLNDGMEWNVYSQPLVLDTDGTHVIYYRAVDRAGNVEEVKQQLVHMDRTWPQFRFVVNGTVLEEEGSIEDYQTVTADVYDVLSGLASAKIILDGMEYSAEDGTGMELDLAGRIGIVEAIVIAEDQAGNRSERTFRFHVATSLYSMQQIIDRLVMNGELGGPLEVQLLNRLDQAQHQLDIGRPGQAAKHMEQLVIQLNHLGLEEHLTERARAVLIADAESLIGIWQTELKE